MGGAYALKGDFIKDNTFNQFLNVNARVGTSFKINRNLRINPYGIVGFNVSHYSSQHLNKHFSYQPSKQPSQNSSEYIDLEGFTVKEIKNRDDAIAAIKQMEIRNQINWDYENYLATSTPHNGRFARYEVSDYNDVNGNGTINVKDGDFCLRSGCDGIGASVYHNYVIYIGYRAYAENIFKQGGELMADGRTVNPVEEFDIDNVASVMFKNRVTIFYYINVKNIGLDDGRGSGIGAFDENEINELIGKNFAFAKNGKSIMNITNKQAVQQALNNEISEIEEITKEQKTDNKVGLNAGAGVDFVIKERWTVGAEYRYSQVNFSGLKAKTHNVGVKFGVQFL